MALSLDVRALAREVRSRKLSDAEGEAAAARKEREKAIIDRANQAAEAVAKRATSTERAKLALAADVVEGVCYWPEFLSKEEERSLIAAIDLVSENRWIGGESDDRFSSACCSTSTTAPPPATSTSTTTSTNIRPPPGRRRRANFGGSPSLLSNSEDLPQFLMRLCEALTFVGAFDEEQPANHVLINDYSFGAGLPRHRDGPLYAASATITLCGPAALELHRIKGEEQEEEKDGTDCEKSWKINDRDKKSIQLLLRPRAALSLRAESYERWDHGVPAVDVDTIREDCANRREAGVEIGEKVPRACRRISLVFVNKRKNVSSGERW